MSNNDSLVSNDIDVRSICIQLLNDKYLAANSDIDVDMEKVLQKEDEVSDIAAKQFDPEFWYLRKMLFWIDKKGLDIPSNFRLSLVEDDRWDQQLCHIPYDKKFIIQCIENRLPDGFSKDHRVDYLKKTYNDLLKDVTDCKNIANEIVTGMLCYSLLIGVESNILTDFSNIEFRKIVRTKHSIIHSSLLNKLWKDNLIEKLGKKEINGYDLVFMSRKQMLPKFYENKVRMQLRRVEMEDAEIVDPEKMEDGFYECKRCHKKKTRHFSVQMRSADEPATNFVRCYICHFTDKFQ